MTDQPVADLPTPGLDDHVLALARQTLEELLSKMDIAGQVVAHWGELEEGDDARPVLLDIEGDDLSLLIGPKGATLAALQTITRLIVAKNLSNGVNLLVDVEGYRQRRETQLRGLARRIAEQVVQRGRAMSLEPMPASERRLIHLELRDHPQVRTESVGEGDRRKVTIIPK
jgi:spoIIIJ-associated protein